MNNSTKKNIFGKVSSNTQFLFTFHFLEITIKHWM